MKEEWYNTNETNMLEVPQTAKFQLLFITSKKSSTYLIKKQYLTIHNELILIFYVYPLT